MKKGYWAIIVGVLIIIAGLSGQFVLRGTNSSLALVVFGGISLLAGLALSMGHLIESRKTGKKANPQEDAIFHLARTGTPKEVQSAIDKGENVNAQNKEALTPLMFAARDNCLEVVTMLLQAGADVHARAQVNGWTPLVYAASGNKNAEVIRTLLKAGADINAQNSKGVSP